MNWYVFFSFQIGAAYGWAYTYFVWGRKLKESNRDLNKTISGYALKFSQLNWSLRDRTPPFDTDPYGHQKTLDRMEGKS